MEIYLDNNATAQPFSQVVDAVTRAMSEGYGNPSSPHSRGAAARTLLIRGLEAIAGLAGGDAGGLVLTSGGTESNNLVFSSIAGRVSRPRVAVTAAEHPSVLNPAEAVATGRLAVLPLLADGTVDLVSLSAELEEGLDIVSVQWANGETGVVQPIAEVARLCRLKGVPFHSDAAQAFGRVPLALNASGVDMATLSAHKMHGPIGVGALWTRNKRSLIPAMLGGGQQGGMRSGTENIPAVAGFAAACSVRAGRFDDDVRKMKELRDGFERALLEGIPGAVVNGVAAERLCNTSSIRFEDVDGQALVAQLDRVGVMCSQTSACSSGRPEPSPALLAMGLSESEAWSAVRFSLSANSTWDEVEVAAREVVEAVVRLRQFMVFR